MMANGIAIAWEPGPSGTRAALSGALSAATAAAVRAELLPGFAGAAVPATVDLAGVSYLDGAGTAVLLELDRNLRAAGTRLSIEGADAAAAGVLALVDWELLAGLPARPAQRGVNVLTQVGSAALQIASEARQLVAFVGWLVLDFGRDLPSRRMRWREVARLVETSGADAALKIDYARFMEVEAFTRFGSRLEEESAQLIRRGERLRELKGLFPDAARGIREQGRLGSSAAEALGAAALRLGR